MTFISFKNFLLQEESLSNEQIIDHIKNECSEFLKEIDFRVNPSIDTFSSISYNQVPRALWRSAQHDADVFIKLSGNRLRTPTDTNLKMHTLLVKHLSNQFGYPYRSLGVFCSTSKLQATEYPGTPFLIFPIGEYEYVYSPIVRDAFEQFDGQSSGNEPTAWKQIFSKFKDENKEDYLDEDGYILYNKWYDLVYEYLEKYKPYTNTDLKSALDTYSKDGIEVVVKCNNYYGVSVDSQNRPAEDRARIILKGISQ